MRNFRAALLLLSGVAFESGCNFSQITQMLHEHGARPGLKNSKKRVAKKVHFISKAQMQSEIQILLEKNRRWAKQTLAEDPAFFTKLSNQQQPEILWIGCSDSRVPATQIVDLKPGSIFVHRNIANVVVHSDLNCLSVMQYAVEVLQVRHIIVCGHYGCGGVLAALEKPANRLIDNWIEHIRDVRRKYADTIAKAQTPAARHDLLCQLNVEEQVRNVCESSIVQAAWEKGQALSVHGWIYRLSTGQIEDLRVSRYPKHLPKS